MKYAFSLICPPLALLACGKRNQAIMAAILFVLAIATARYGIGALVEFFLILWACRVVGEEDAGREARAFIKTVRPIPYLRDHRTRI